MFRYFQIKGRKPGKKIRRVTFCVPAYNAESFIKETLQSIQEQTITDFECVISVDKSDDQTFEIVSLLPVDKRFHVFRQNERLGWAGNVNFSLKKATSPYVCIVPHDDLLHPRYLERLLSVIEKDPDIAAVYSDIETFGDGHRGTIVQNSVIGRKLERITNYLEHHFNAVVFRAIVNRKLVGDAIYCSSNGYDDFAEDTIWGLQLAMKGNLIRIPEVLYNKRYLPSSYHHQWQKWPPEKKMDAWIGHILRCIEVLKQDPDLADHRGILTEAVVSRFYQTKARLWNHHILKDRTHSPHVVKRWVIESLKSDA